MIQIILFNLQPLPRKMAWFGDASSCFPKTFERTVSAVPSGLLDGLGLRPAFGISQPAAVFLTVFLARAELARGPPGRTLDEAPGHQAGLGDLKPGDT